MQDEPPNWLKDVLAQHTPIPGVIDMVCTCSCDIDVTVWTPEHVARAVHNRLAEAVESLYV